MRADVSFSTVRTLEEEIDVSNDAGAEVVDDFDSSVAGGPAEGREIKRVMGKIRIRRAGQHEEHIIIIMNV